MNGVFKFRSVTSVVIASAETGRDTRNKIVLSTEKKKGIRSSAIPSYINYF